MDVATLRRLCADKDARSGYKRRIARKQHLRPEFVRSHAGRVFFSGDSITLERKRIKYVRPDLPYFPFTAGELARQYLDLLLAAAGLKRLSGRWKMTDWHREALTIPAPLYFDPKRGREGHFVYVDINACYFELMKRWPLNLGFNHRTGAISMPRPAVYIPQEDWAWLRENKPIRHAIFGMLGAQQIMWYKDGRFQAKDMLGQYGAPELHARVKLELHAIARRAVSEFGCHMWLTDAGIFNSRASEFMATLPLASSIKAEGVGHLYAFGDYRIGETVGGAQHIDLRGITNLEKYASAPYVRL